MDDLDSGLFGIYRYTINAMVDALTHWLDYIFVKHYKQYFLCALGALCILTFNMVFSILVVRYRSVVQFIFTFTAYVITAS